MFDFCHSKNSSDNMKKKINFISIIIFLKKKKKVLVNKYETDV